MLRKKRYRALSAMQMAFQVSPVCVLLYILFSLVYALMQTVGTALATANFVDTATAILNGTRPRDDIYLPLVFLLLVLGVFTTNRSIIQLFGARIELKLQHGIKPAIVKKHAALDFKHIENAESWELISRVSRDPMKSIMEGFCGFAEMMQILVCVISVLVLIVTQVWWAALIVLFCSLPMFWLSVRAGRKNYQAGRDSEKFKRRVVYLDEVLTERDATDERTLFGYSDAVGKRWLEQYEALRGLNLKVWGIMILIKQIAGTALSLITLLVVLTLIAPVISGQMTAGMFMGIVGAVFGMMQQLGWQLPRSLEQISGTGEYMKDLTEFLTLSEAEGALELPDASPIAFVRLEFRDVRFKYPSGGEYILNGLSFVLESGRHYAFVGRNGAGKTTITKLLTGLYTEYEGEILINDRELRTYPASTLKALFSVVYQDFAQYYISLRDNLLLGDAADSSALERIPGTVNSAGLDEVVQELKNGLDTPLGKIKPDGQDVSGGQWQRVAIARSLISRAPVKTLDEPTAALDPISESRVYEEFEKLMRGKTTIFISHRLGSTKLADEILVIDGGQIIERGTHDELMEANRQYAEMFESQRGWYQ